VIAITAVDVTDDEEASFRYRELTLGTGLRNDYGIVGNGAAFRRLVVSAIPAWARGLVVSRRA
jgi:hypothetical protein